MTIELNIIIIIIIIVENLIKMINISFFINMTPIMSKGGVFNPYF